MTYVMIRPNTVRSYGIILILIVLVLCPALAHSKDEHAPGKIAVRFKNGVNEEDAVRFIEQFGLEIINKIDFGIRCLDFNVEKDIDAFIKDLRKEDIVSSVSKGEKLAINQREGTVVKIRFKQGVERKRIDELKSAYSGSKDVIAWRYQGKGPSYIILKVPPGKEKDWADTISSAKYGELVESVNLLYFDVPD